MIRVNRFPLEVLVELIAAHDGQSLQGSPSDRIEGRLRRSIELARKAGLSDLTVYLDREDMQWLCEIRGIGRFSSAAGRLRVDHIAIQRASIEFESHVAGYFSDGQPGTFPLMREPTHTPGFVQHHASDEEKRDLLSKFVAMGHANALEGFRPSPGSKAH